MNQTQRKYAIDRMNQIKREAIRNLDVEQNKLITCLSDVEKINQIRSGKAKIKKTITCRYGLSISDVFTFVEKDNSAKIEFLQKKIKDIESSHNLVCDEIMLGDQDLALRLISNFEKKHSN